MADTNDIRSSVSVESAASQAGEATPALGERGPREGMLGAVADSLEKTGRYMQEEGIRGMAEDVTELIRRNPIPAMLVGVGIGFLLAKVLRRRS